jgi:hypothetical protein
LSRSFLFLRAQDGFVCSNVSNGEGRCAKGKQNVAVIIHTDEKDYTMSAHAIDEMKDEAITIAEITDTINDPDYYGLSKTSVNYVYDKALGGKRGLRVVVNENDAVIVTFHLIPPPAREG